MFKYFVHHFSAVTGSRTSSLQPFILAEYIAFHTPTVVGFFAGDSVFIRVKSLTTKNKTHSKLFSEVSRPGAKLLAPHCQVSQYLACSMTSGSGREFPASSNRLSIFIMSMLSTSSSIDIRPVTETREGSGESLFPVILSYTIQAKTIFCNRLVFIHLNKVADSLGLVGCYGISLMVLLEDRFLNSNVLMFLIRLIDDSTLFCVRR